MAGQSTPATTLLNRRGISYRLHAYSPDHRTDSYGAEAAAALGLGTTAGVQDPDHRAGRAAGSRGCPDQHPTRPAYPRRRDGRQKGQDGVRSRRREGNWLRHWRYFTSWSPKSSRLSSSTSRSKTSRRFFAAPAERACKTSRLTVTTTAGVGHAPLTISDHVVDFVCQLIGASHWIESRRHSSSNSLSCRARAIPLRQAVKAPQLVR
jgi:hypothetical protein